MTLDILLHGTTASTLASYDSTQQCPPQGVYQCRDLQQCQQAQYMGQVHKGLKEQADVRLKNLLMLNSILKLLDYSYMFKTEQIFVPSINV